MTDPKDKDPAEGSRETVENQLQRKGLADGKTSRPDDGKKDQRRDRPQSD